MRSDAAMGPAVCAVTFVVMSGSWVILPPSLSEDGSTFIIITVCIGNWFAVHNSTVTREVHVIGGGLAGCEAAWQIARMGVRAVLYEMRPRTQTPAHKTDELAELVCSNSLKSEQENSAPWLLKEELRRLGSLLIGEIAPRARVPAGHARR